MPAPRSSAWYLRRKVPSRTSWYPTAHEVTVTDDKGIYELKSAKKWGYVFISVPGGYEVAAGGRVPAVPPRAERSGPTVVEQKLTSRSRRSTGQDRLQGLPARRHAPGQPHGRQPAQFTQFTSDLNAYMTQPQRGEDVCPHAGRHDVGPLLVHKQLCCCPQYLGADQRVRSRGLQIFHTMGNHDNDFMTTSDYDRGRQVRGLHRPDLLLVQHRSGALRRHGRYRLQQHTTEPTRTTTSKTHLQRTIEVACQGSGVRRQVDASDRGHACASIQAHELRASAFDHDSANTEALLAALDGYEVHFVTGHTHKVYNITPDDDVVKGRDIHEHNSGAICASWWWSGNLTPGVHVSIDGAPGGYADLGYRRNRFRMALQIHRLARGVPVPQLRPQQRIVLDGRRPQHSLERTDPARLQEIRQRLPRKLGQRSAHQDMELEQQLGAERRRRAGQDARIHAGMGIRSAPYRSALRAALQQFRHHLHALVRHENRPPTSSR